MIKQIICTLFAFLSSQMVYSQTFEDSTCWEYFKITQDLKNDKPLDKKTWKPFICQKTVLP